MPLKNLMCIIPVLFEWFSFFRKHRYSGFDDRRRSMILGWEDITARPAYFSTKSRECLDEDSCLDSHMEWSSDFCSSEWFCISIFFTESHQSWHFRFSDFEPFASPRCKGHICYSVIHSWFVIKKWTREVYRKIEITQKILYQNASLRVHWFLLSTGDDFDLKYDWS